MEEIKVEDIIKVCISEGKKKTCMIFLETRPDTRLPKSRAGGQGQ